MVGAFGARGVGKTAWARRWIEARRPQRLAVWDYKHDPMLVGLGRPIDTLPELCKAMIAPRFKVQYLVDHDGDVKAQFDVFCRACWLAGDMLAYVTELPEVTGPGRAPKSWKKCVNVGREYRRHDGRIVGLTIVGDGQRMPEIDHAFTSNLDIIHCGRMGDEDDARAAAKKLGVPWPELLTLPDLHWVERAHGEPAARRGVLTFRSASKKSSPAP